MIISVDFLEFHPISVMFGGYSHSTSMRMQLRAENSDSIDRKALEYDQNMYVLNEYVFECYQFFSLYPIGLISKYLQ